MPNSTDTNFSETEKLFSINGNKSLLPEDRRSNSNIIDLLHIDNDTNYDDDESVCILCVLFKNHQLGAAYFRGVDQQLYILQQMIDTPPEFGVTRSFLREVHPTHIITIGNTCDVFVKCIVSILKCDDNDGNSSNSYSFQNSSTLPSNITLLTLKEYNFENCEYKVSNIHLLSEPEHVTVAQKEVFLHALIDFDCNVTVYALGALVKYLEKEWSSLSHDGTELNFLQINRVSLKDSVLIDRNTFNGLQVFQLQSHDSNFKHGNQSSNREGYSIFRLLSQYCKSKLGYQCLRNILGNPTKKIEELNMRLDFIQFALLPTNQNLIENLQQAIKKISNLSLLFDNKQTFLCFPSSKMYFVPLDATSNGEKILRKIHYSRGTGRDWETLYTTIYYTLFLNETCSSHVKSIALFAALDATIKTQLYDLQNTLNSALDFSQLNKRTRPLIKFGLDSELDKKELRKQYIAKNATAAALIVVNELPAFLSECTVVYMPEMGHFVVVKEWKADCDKHELEKYGFQFVFELNGCFHYKNPLCVDLDRELGNIHLDILSHENRIIQRLTEYVLKGYKEICEPLKIIALMDCLIAMSCMIKERDYVRPTLNEDSVYEVIDGRHPLLETICNDFVPNNYYSGGQHSKMKIITGPNDSGKRCYVPAKQANIGLVHSIHSRIHTTESAGVSLSAFMIDLSQMSQSLYNAKSNSLVLIDEFGRGTAGDDGFALLAGALRKFSEDEDVCPHVLVSTHFQKISQHLPKNKRISYLKMDHEKQNSDIVFLYKAVEGISNSFAFDVANAAGLDESIITRAREFYQLLCNDSLPSTNDDEFKPITFSINDIEIPDIE